MFRMRFTKKADQLEEAKVHMPTILQKPCLLNSRKRLQKDAKIKASCLFYYSGNSFHSQMI